MRVRPEEVVEESIPPSVSGEPARVLGVFDATCIVIGAIVGVGIFFTPSSVARIAGSGRVALLAWGCAGVVAMLGALTFAGLGKLYKANGGQYHAIRDAWGAVAGFAFVVCNATAVQAGAIAIIAIVCCENIGVAASGEATAGWVTLVGATALILGLVGANVVGVKWGSRIQNLTTVAKLATLLAVTGLAAWFGGKGGGNAPTAIETTARQGWLAAAVFMAMVPAFFSYGGWQHALWIAGEIKDTERKLPLATVVGVLIVIAVYLAANWAYLRLLGADGVAGTKTLAADAVGQVWANVGRRVVAGAVAVSAFGVLNAQFLGGPRLIYGLARDGRFFRAFSRLHLSWGTPVAAICLLGGMALALLFAAGKDGIDKLLTGVVFVDGVFFSLTGAALVTLRVRAKTGVLPLVAPALFVVGEVGIVCGAMAEESNRWGALIGAGWVVASVVVYLVWFGRSSGEKA
ncbi:MAG: APC family permease [Phycisphaerales bacterium]